MKVALVFVLFIVGIAVTVNSGLSFGERLSSRSIDLHSQEVELHEEF